MSRVELIGVAKTYDGGVAALHPTSLEIAPGSFVVLLGPSGAGKSTLLRTINRLETPSAGEVRIGAEAVGPANLRQLRGRIGMVFQHFNLVGRLNVMTNVLCGRLGKHRGLASLLFLMGRADIDKAHAVLARVGLTDKAWERADRLSGGQQQRVGIARALVQEPALLLADEPVSSVDRATAREIMDLLADICRSDGITTIVSLHQVALARRYGERVIGLNGGRVVFDGPVGGLTEPVLNRIYGEAAAAEDGDDTALANG
ncbi:MAG: phosphonate ABC transporter ATP-binding protein [Alphaproteobacteria bacterium]|jgi:phosphonate transport system ATP-binding protein|nr:phosphonate ABC transporter ATP-binding protein [Alphaproteobacteria bacterium]MDP6515193.1 phosphonate ABC transporter ATP-binding protein [Alphaproteobacteria bacterium]